MEKQTRAVDQKLKINLEWPKLTATLQLTAATWTTWFVPCTATASARALRPSASHINGSVTDSEGTELGTPYLLASLIIWMFIIFFIRTCNMLTTKGIHNCRSTYTTVMHSSYMSHTGWCNSSTHCKSNTNTTYDDPVHPDYRTAYLCALHVWSMTSRTTITGNVLASAKLPWAAAIIRNDCTENQTTCCSSARTNHR